VSVVGIGACSCKPPSGSSGGSLCPLASHPPARSRLATLERSTRCLSMKRSLSRSSRSGRWLMIHGTVLEGGLTGRTARSGLAFPRHTCEWYPVFQARPQDVETLERPCPLGRADVRQSVSRSGLPAVPNRPRSPWITHACGHSWRVTTPSDRYPHGPSRPSRSTWSVAACRCSCAASGLAGRIRKCWTACSGFTNIETSWRKSSRP